MERENVEGLNSVKIAQITAYRISYGSALQAFATQIAFKKCGMLLELFCYEPDGRDNLKRRILKCVRHPSTFIDKGREYWSDFIHKGYMDIKRRRNKDFSSFIQRNIVSTEVINTKEQRDKRICNYKTVLSGSDQTWNPINFGEKYFTCEFVPDSIKLISYASSFGTEKIPNNQWEGTKRYLQRFSKISLRETSGRDIVERLTGQAFPVVLDPTLLLQRDEWNRLAFKVRQVNSKYIFMYFLSAQKEFRKQVVDLKQKTNLQIATVPHVSRYVQADIDYSDILIEESAPDQWVELIRDAEYICTDSYHGMVFSIIFKKQFLVMKRFRDGSKVSANTRIYEVLNKLGLMDRLWNGGDIYSQMRHKIDYDLVDRKLESYRDLSYNYIKNILNED